MEQERSYVSINQKNDGAKNAKGQEFVCTVLENAIVVNVEELFFVYTGG